jgi:hypothetical protein
MHHSNEWCVSSDEVSIGDSRWQDNSESIAQTPGILDGCPTPATADGYRDRSSSRNQFVEPHRFNTASLRGIGVERAEEPQKISGILQGTGSGVGSLKGHLILDLGDCVSVEKATKFRGAEQVCEELGVDREGLSATLRQGGIAFVHKGGDVAKQQRPRERTRVVCRHGGHGDVAGLNAFQQRAQSGEVVDVVETLAHGLQHDREVGIVSGYL